MIIGNDVHNFVFFATKLSFSPSPFYISMVEVIVNNSPVSDPAYIFIQ